jgi:uncharacterized protein
MKIQLEIVIPPEKVNDKDFLYDSAARLTGKDTAEIDAVTALRRSLDARSRVPVYRVLADIYVNEKPPVLYPPIIYKKVEGKHKVIIIGAGPAGMFSALQLIELGIKPVILERGKDVQARRKDLRNIQQFHIVDPDSNYCFGEGGAGTYSDGKLYTRSKKRGNTKKIINILVQHGAKEDILVDSHPHIGSNKLPEIIKGIRETIITNGGEIHFNSRVTDFIIDDKVMKGVVVDNQEEYTADSVILATGHSARDIYYLLHKHNIRLEPKEYAMGVRIEHPQALIDEIQYHSKEKNPYLPAAAYNLSCQVDGRGVYSFCMCPGGIIIPASTAPGELVINGMSLSRRDTKYANSGFVVTVESKDWSKFDEFHPLNALKFQQDYEQTIFNAGNGSQSAPAQRMTDFVEGKLSTDLPKSSYIPGVLSAPLHEVLPPFLSKSLREALVTVDKKMKGYFTSEAQILAGESRTSSPVRIPRDPETFMHPDIEGFFPSGEGAGFAGGIVSTAVDGENCAKAAAKFIYS